MIFDLTEFVCANGQLLVSLKTLDVVGWLRLDSHEAGFFMHGVDWCL